MSKIKIDKDIALPTARSNMTTYPFASMEIGDSFLIAADLAARVRNAAQMFSRRHGPAKFATRKADGGVRVWRTQ